MTKKKTILIVDDDYEVVESMRLALTAVGYAVTTARNGDQGLAMAENDRPDLIILDMMMPKRSGFLVLETLRQTRVDMPRIIVITANEGNRHREYALQLGADAYLTKPFPMATLLAAVEGALN